MRANQNDHINGEPHLNTMKLATHVAALAAFAGLAGCVTSEHQIATAGVPAKPRPAVVAVQPPPPPPVVVVRTPAPPPPVHVAAPGDVYIAGIADRDVVFVGGSTYLWVVGADGRRHRQFYARGDRRAEVFRRREHLRVEMARHGGHPPGHAMAPHHDEHRPQHAGRPAYAHQPPHRPQHGDGSHVGHADAGHRPQPGTTRVAEQRGHEGSQGPRDHRQAPRVDEAQQPQHRQGHAGA